MPDRRRFLAALALPFAATAATAAAATAAWAEAATGAEAAAAAGPGRPPQLLLAREAAAGLDPAPYLVSEKYDGVRA